jgi:hypothetical protein
LVRKHDKNSWNLSYERVKCGKLTGTDNQEKTDKGKCAKGFNASLKPPSNKSVISNLWLHVGRLGSGERSNVS